MSRKEAFDKCIDEILNTPGGTIYPEMLQPIRDYVDYLNTRSPKPTKNTKRKGTK